MSKSKSWLVAVAGHICVALHDGTAKTLGVMIPDIVRYYQTEDWVVGLIIALMASVGSCVCLLIGPLSEKLSARSIIMTAGFLASAGLVLVSWVTISMTGFGAILILLTGVNVRIAFVMSLANVGQYFDRYYSTANSLVLMGSSTGVMICAPLSQFLIIEYGWHGALFIFSGILANIMVCGAVLKGPHHKPVPENIYSDSHSDIQEREETEEHVSSYTSLPKHQTHMDKFGISLFRYQKFIVLIASMFAAFFEWAGWLIYVVPHAEHKGLTSYQATSLATAGGMGNLFGKLTIPILIDRKLVLPIRVLFLGLLISGFALIFDQIFNDFTTLLFLSGCFGFGFGNSSLAIFVLVKQYCRNKDLPKALAWLTLASGVARLTAGFFIGWLAKVTGNYNMSWIVMGIVTFIGAVIVGFDIIIDIVVLKN